MSIVKMKRLKALGMTSDRQALLKKLQSLGCVEIRLPEDTADTEGVLTLPDSRALDGVNTRIQELEAALEILRKYAPQKDKLLSARPEVAEDKLFDEAAYQRALTVAGELCENQRKLTAHQTQRGKLLSQRSALAPWLELPVALDFSGTARTSACFASAPLNLPRSAVTERLDAVTELYDLTWCGTDKECQYFFLLCHESAAEDVQSALLDAGCARLNLKNWSGTAAENDARLQDELSELDGWIEGRKSDIVENGIERDALRLALDRARQDAELERVKLRLPDSGSAFFLEGWMPADKEKKVVKVLEDYGMAYELTEPTQEEYPQVPVQLKNGPLSSPMNMVTEMYSLPAYGSIDPNPLMMPFFVLFYGIMMADMGYGIIMMLAGLIGLKKMKPKGTMKNLLGLLALCGVSTFIIGAMTGGFFGDFIPQILKIIDPASTFEMPALFTPLNDTLAILIGSLCLGFVQVITGMVINFVKRTRNGEFIDTLLDEGAWWVIFAGAALMILGIGNVGGVPVTLCVGGVMLVAGCFKKSPGIGVLGTLVGAVYNGVTGVFQDVLSYSRLMALMLSGSIIASVFNTLGSITGNVVAFVIISMIGNTLNFVLNILGCFVHDLRLQCLEFFGKFYEDGGKPFKPLAINTKYVDILKEEQ